MKLESEKFKLSNNMWPRRIFNPNSAEDLKAYQYFIENDRWSVPGVGEGCPFIIEWPFLNVVHLIQHKIIAEHIGGLVNRAKKEKTK
jgi:hypothetical protein